MAVKPKATRSHREEGRHLSHLANPLGCAPVLAVHRLADTCSSHVDHVAGFGFWFWSSHQALGLCGSGHVHPCCGAQIILLKLRQTQYDSVSTDSGQHSQGSRAVAAWWPGRDGEDRRFSAVPQLLLAATSPQRARELAIDCPPF